MFAQKEYCFLYILKRSLFTCCIFSIIISCSNEPKRVENPNEVSKKIKEKLIKVNKSQTYSEQSQIEDFLKRYQYPVMQTSTGLRYYIYKTTKGIKPGKESVVLVKYEVKLLDGTVCYNSTITGDLEFQIGKTDLPIGLQEAVQLLNVGEKALLITPSKLGYGLTGDGENIPPNAVLVYDIELLKIIKP